MGIRSPDEKADTFLNNALSGRAPLGYAEFEFPALAKLANREFLPPADF